MCLTSRLLISLMKKRHIEKTLITETDAGGWIYAPPASVFADIVSYSIVIRKYC